MSEDHQMPDPSGDERDSPPLVPTDSPGSSASSRLQEEYSQLLKYTAQSTPGLASILLPREEKTAAEDEMEPIGTMVETLSYVDVLNQNGNNTVNPSPSFKLLTDTAVTSMGSKLDDWLTTLKQSILEELLSSLTTSGDSQLDEHKKATIEIQMEKTRLQKELNCLNDRIHSLEHSLKQKSSLVKNLADSFAAQKNKIELAKQFYHWKSDLQDKQREAFTEKIAVRHHQKKLNLRVLKAWHGLIQCRWRGRVERKCQNHAQGVCLDLSNDYEAKIAGLNKKISALEQHVSTLQTEKEAYSDNVKKAFMRGMCALNMETMSLFEAGQQQQLQRERREGERENGNRESGDDRSDTSSLMSEDKLSSALTTLPSESAYQTSKAAAPSGRSGGTCPPASSSGTLSAPFNTSPGPNMPSPSSFSQPHAAKHARQGMPCSSSKVIKTKTKVQKSTKGGQILAPPMASVTVERYQPVTKKTVGKATAVTFPKKVSGGVTQHCGKGKSTLTRYKPIAGQDGSDGSHFFKDVVIKVVD